MYCPEVPTLQFCVITQTPVASSHGLSPSDPLIGHLYHLNVLPLSIIIAEAPGLIGSSELCAKILP